MVQKPTHGGVQKLYKFANKIGKGIRGAFQKFGKFAKKSENACQSCKYTGKPNK